MTGVDDIGKTTDWVVFETQCDLILLVLAFLQLLSDCIFVSFIVAEERIGVKIV